MKDSASLAAPRPPPRTPTAMACGAGGQGHRLHAAPEGTKEGKSLAFLRAMQPRDSRAPRGARSCLRVWGVASRQSPRVAVASRFSRPPHAPVPAPSRWRGDAPGVRSWTFLSPRPRRGAVRRRACAVAPAKATCAVGDPVTALCGFPPLPLLLAVAPGVCPRPRPGLRRPFPGGGAGALSDCTGQDLTPSRAEDVAGSPQLWGRGAALTGSWAEAGTGSPRVVGLSLGDPSPSEGDRTAS